MKRQYGHYDRLIYKINNYEKYRNDFAIKIDDATAHYFGDKQFSDQVQLVSRGYIETVWIIARIRNLIEYSDRNPLDA